MLTRRLLLTFLGSTIASVFVHKQPALARVQTADQLADDTNWLQTELDKGGHIRLEKGRTYKVSAPPGERSALYIGPDTFLDLAGATLVLAPDQRCSLLAQKDSASPINNITIANGTIQGNGKQQPGEYSRALGITPTFYLLGCNNLEIRNLTMRDTYMYAIFSHGDGGFMDNIDVDNAIGGGILLKGKGWQVDNIEVRNVSFFERVNCPANPFIVSLKDSAIGQVYCENFGYGVKLQDGCENLTVESIIAIGGPNNNDYLVKIQGRQYVVNDRPNRNIKIGRILARNGPNSGLYIYYSFDVEIESYEGENNGQHFNLDNKNRSDILVIDSDRVHFGELSAKAYPFNGLWLHGTTGRVEADSANFTSDSRQDPVVVRNGVAVLAGTEYLP